MSDLFSKFARNVQGAYDLLSSTAMDPASREDTSAFSSLLQESAGIYKTDSPLYLQQALFSLGWSMGDADGACRMLYEQEPEKLIRLQELAMPADMSLGYYDDRGKLDLSDPDFRDAAENLRTRGRLSVLHDAFNSYDGHDAGIRFFDDVVQLESAVSGSSHMPSDPQEMGAFFNQVFSRIEDSPTDLDVRRTEHFFEDVPYTFADWKSHCVNREASAKNEPDREDFFSEYRSHDLRAKQCPKDAMSYFSEVPEECQDEILTTIEQYFHVMDRQISARDGYEPDLSKPLVQPNRDGIIRQMSSFCDGDPVKFFPVDVREQVSDTQLSSLYFYLVSGMQTAEDFVKRQKKLEGFQSQVVLFRERQELGIAESAYRQEELSRTLDAGLIMDFDIDFNRVPDEGIAVPQAEAEFVKDYAADLSDVSVDKEADLGDDFSVRIPTCDPDEGLVSELADDFSEQLE